MGWWGEMVALREAVRPWWLGSRPKTLAASTAPVIVGTALAAYDGSFKPLPALAALIAALLIQIGTNLSNDVLDFRRGADHGRRLGPTRVVQAGLLSARAVTIGAAVCYGLAAIIGLYLIAVAGWPILVIGVASIVSGVLYTAGPMPLAYVGLGDLFVLVFFGLAAVGGSYYVQALRFTPTSVVLGIAVGLLAVGILAVNNLRDVDTDREAGKRTMAVRLGAPLMRRYYALVVVVAFGIPVILFVIRWLPWTALTVLLAVPFAVPPVQSVLGGLVGTPLNKVLGQTSRLQIAYALCLSFGLLAGRAV
jgi:1,4-dihydroxy-2-naphthoate polyprenyltransferase